MITRHLKNELLSKMNDRKVIVLMGARQVGKTSLMQEIIGSKKNVLWMDGDDTDTRSWFENPNATKLRQLIGTNTTLVIDEAQRIENIGLCLKIIYDKIPSVKVWVTGSSSFELANKINEPLTGRKWEYTLFPLSFSEMAQNMSVIEETRLLEYRMIFGYYPEVAIAAKDAVDILKQHTNSYLYKDILTWERIQKPDKMERLVQAIAFQVGNLVSYHELGQMAGLSSETVENYINLLEKSFIVFRLGTYSRNLRNELKKSRKIYFYDNGIRNAVINQFNPLNLRDDVGALWENFLIAERMKYNHYNKNYVNRYFWRTKEKQEVDYLEEGSGVLNAFEFKWNPKTKVKFPLKFMQTYNPNTAVINRQNFTDFII